MTNGVDVSGLQIPPELAGSFSQIPLDNDLLIPYSDLKAGSAYGRKLILPDDVIPTLSLVTLAKHPNGPRLWTGAHVEGAADVFVVGQSGGTSSGATAPIQDRAAYVGFDTGGAGAYNIAGIATGATRIYGATLGAQVLASGGGGDEYHLIELVVRDTGGTSPFIPLVQIAVAIIGGTTYPAVWVERSVEFDTPIDIYTNSGLSDPHLYIIGGSSAGIKFTASYSYSS